MQVKFDKFLALTAMLASAQLNTACVEKNDDATDTADTDGKEDSGATSTTLESSSNADAGSSNADSNNTDSNGTSDVNPTGVLDAALTRDAAADNDAGGSGDAGDAQARDGSVWVDGGGAADASNEGGSDAGGEGDPSTESSPDAGGEGDTCDLGDFADEGFGANCALVGDSCLETAYPGVGDICFTHIQTKRAAVTQAFWDCYVAQDISDPCTEEAETAAYLCADAADEGICITSLSDCASVSANCPSADQAYCETLLASYNSNYVQNVVACAAYKADGQDPGYEGCAYDFEQCVYSPSVE